MIRFNKSINIINICPNKEICQEIGLVEGCAYQVEDIFDVRNNNNGKEECLKVLKIRNLFEYKKYIGDWAPGGSKFTDTVKNIVGYKSDENNIIYMSKINKVVSYLCHLSLKYFLSVHISKYRLIIEYKFTIHLFINSTSRHFKIILVCNG